MEFKKDRNFRPREKSFSHDSPPRKEDRSFDTYPVKPVRKFRPRKKNMLQQEAAAADGPIRLNKYIANAGICSRRDADGYIKAGLVTVNGAVVTEMGVKVSRTDEIRFNGQGITPEKKVYIILNKPKDFVTTLDDPNAKRTVMELVKGACPERVYPVGRLDRMTTGVLLLTNDGEMAKKLTHPKYEKKKVYHVSLDKNLTRVDFETIATGVQLDDGVVKADSIHYVGEKRSEVGIEIHSGKNRVIRRIFEHLDYKVRKLDRVYFAGLTKKGLQRGQWRFLEEKEIAMLKMGAYA